MLNGVHRTASKIARNRIVQFPPLEHNYYIAHSIIILIIIYIFVIIWRIMTVQLVTCSINEKIIVCDAERSNSVWTQEVPLVCVMMGPRRYCSIPAGKLYTQTQHTWTLSIVLNINLVIDFFFFSPKVRWVNHHLVTTCTAVSVIISTALCPRAQKKKKKKNVKNHIAVERTDEPPKQMGVRSHPLLQYAFT